MNYDPIIEHVIPNLFWNLIPQIDSYTLKLVQSDKSLMHVFIFFFSTFEKIILTKESNSDV